MRCGIRTDGENAAKMNCVMMADALHVLSSAITIKGALQTVHALGNLAVAGSDGFHAARAVDEGDGSASVCC
jgi:hypothetical protein